MNSARLVDIRMMEKVTIPLYQHIPKAYLHSNQFLQHPKYHWRGEIHLKNVKENDVVVTIDAWAFRQRHQEDARIIHLRTGSFKSTRSKIGDQIPLKLMGVVRENELLIVTKESNERVKDIAPQMPVKVAGVNSALKAQEETTQAAQDSLF